MKTKSSRSQQTNYSLASSIPIVSLRDLIPLKDSVSLACPLAQMALSLRKVILSPSRQISIFNGSTQVSFTITDGVNEIEAAKFIAIDAVNDAPTIQLASASTHAESAAETMTSFSVSAGIERFFSISDFGYQDVEGNPLNSISIELPSSAIGTLYLGSGDYKTDGIDLALTEGVNNDGTAARVSRTDIESGKLYFLAAQTAIGKSVTLEFDVSDGDRDSEVPGLFEFNVIGAPKSADETDPRCAIQSGIRTDHWRRTL